MNRYLIRFRFPEGTWYAAMLNDGLGFTRNLEDALTWDDYVAAINTLRNGYGDETRNFGDIVVNVS